jgi:hypothetical protein
MTRSASTAFWDRTAAIAHVDGLRPLDDDLLQRHSRRPDGVGEQSLERPVMNIGARDVDVLEREAMSSHERT